jgi:hypothetical protein
VSQELLVASLFAAELMGLFLIMKATTIPGTVADLKDLPVIPVDTPVTIEVLRVGSIFAGRRLVVRVQF